MGHLLVMISGVVGMIIMSFELVEVRIVVRSSQSGSQPNSWRVAVGHWSTNCPRISCAACGIDCVDWSRLALHSCPARRETPDAGGFGALGHAIPNRPAKPVTA